MEDIFLNPLAWYGENTIQLYCPCHKDFFAIDDGRLLTGPPKRPLPRILVQVKDETIWATGMKLPPATLRQQRSNDTSDTGASA